MKLDKDKIVTGIYLGLYTVDAIYINKDLCYEQQTGDVIYYPSGDRTYYIVWSKGTTDTTDIVIPNTYRNKPVKEISPNAFSGTDITSVTIPESITKIGNSAFSSCQSLQIVNYNAKDCEGFIENEIYPFWGSGNNLTVNIGNNVVKIPNYMFADSYVKTLNATGTALKTIGDNAFRYCSKLTEVNLSNDITSIGENAFHNCERLTTVTIPNNIESMGPYAFSNVLQVYYYGEKPYNLIKEFYIDRYRRFSNSVVFNIPTRTPSLVAKLFDDGTLIVADDNVSIPSYYGDPRIKRLIISNGYPPPIDDKTSQTDYVKKYTIPESLFASCPNLKEVFIPLSMITTENNRAVSLIGERVFTGSPIEKVYFEGNADEWAVVSRQATNEYGEYLDSYGIGIPFTATVYKNRKMFKYKQPE